MKTFEHINDCWSALNDCATKTELEELLAEFPKKFGDWYYDQFGVEEDNDESIDRDVEVKIRVYNSYYDADLDDLSEDSADFYVMNE